MSWDEEGVEDKLEDERKRKGARGGGMGLSQVEFRKPVKMLWIGESVSLSWALYGIMGRTQMWDPTGPESNLVQLPPSFSQLPSRSDG